MRKVTLDEARTGMVIAADVFDPDFDGDLPIIGRGVELSATFIAKLKERGIAELIIATPQGYRGAPGEIFAPQQVTEHILFDGAVELNCDLPPDIRVEAGEDISITGQVGAGCNIRSATGDILITGGVQGAANRHIVLSAARRITIKNTVAAPLAAMDVRSMGEVAIEGDVADSTVAAKGRLRIDGRVVRSKIYSQTRIRVHECGNTSEPCQLLVKPQECRLLFQELLAIDKQHDALLQERLRLQNTIDLIRKLGKDIERLPYDNKVQMAADIKRFRQVEEEIREGQGRKARVRKEITEALAATRIVILKQALPKTRITIENYSRLLDQPVSKVAFFVRNMRVESEPFGE